MKFYLYICLVLLTLQTSNTFCATPAEKLAHARKLEAHGVWMEAAIEFEQYLRQVPGDSEARIQLIDLLLRLNRFTHSLPHINRLRKELPNHPRVREYSLLADQYYKNQFKRQVVRYENRIKRSEQAPEVVLEFARFLINNEKIEYGFEMFNKYLDKRPKDGKTRFELAQNYAWNNKLELSRRHLLVLLNQNPRHIKARLLLADLSYWEGDEVEALEAYRKVIEISPVNREAKDKIARITSTPGYQENQMLETLRKDPHGETLTSLAGYWLKEGREYEADSLIQLRLSVAPDDSLAQLLAAEMEELKHQRYLKQVNALRETLILNPEDTSAMLTLARYYTSIPEFDSSLVNYDRYMELYPVDYLVRLERARVLTWAGHIDEAAEEFRIISITLPDNREANLGLAEAFLASDLKFEEAEEIFRKDLEKYPEELRSRIGYAEALRRQGKYDEAKVIYFKILEQDSSDARAKKGLNWIEKDLTPLIRRLAQRVELNPLDVVSRRQLAGLLYDTKQFWEAEKHVKILLEQDPENIQLKSFLNEIETKKITELSLELQKSKTDLSENPGDIEARLRYADLLAAEGHNEDAAAQYRLLLENQAVPGQDIQMKLAELLLAEQKYEEALLIYGRLADENPAHYEYRYKLALTLSWMGEYERALAEFDRALGLNPESLECRQAIANIHNWSGNPYSAHDEYRRILAIDPTNKVAAEALKNLNHPFFKAGRGVYTTSSDNEDFLIRESRVGIMVNISLRMDAEVGMGNVYFEQTDPRSRERYWFSETGWFVYGNTGYRFDRLTQALVSGRLYTFAERKSSAIRFELTHEFKDVKELKDAAGTIYISSQDAVFDLAATSSLQTWQDELTSEKIGFTGTFKSGKKWLSQGELAYIEISDGNSRTDLWVESRYILQEYLQAGIRYDAVSAEEQKIGYWTPSNYATVNGVVQLENSFTKWNYLIRGTAGRVLKTKNATRSFVIQFQYKASHKLYLGLGYSNLSTSRADGEYQYSGFSGSATWNW